MERLKFIKFAAALLCCALTMGVTSCSDDDNNTNPIATLLIGADTLEVAVDSIAQVTVIGGLAPYAVESSDENIATAVADSNGIVVKGIEAGKAMLTVSDQSGQSGQIEVTVKDLSTTLNFDNDTLGIAIDEEAVVNILNGTAPYTAVAADTLVASVNVTESTITVKGEGAGATTVVITDETGLSGTIKVTVE